MLYVLGCFGHFGVFRWYFGNFGGYRGYFGISRGFIDILVILVVPRLFWRFRGILVILMVVRVF
jgi:hypothetical protein